MKRETFTLQVPGLASAMLVEVGLQPAYGRDETSNFVERVL